MQFRELLGLHHKHTKWTVFVWQNGSYVQFVPKQKNKSKGATALDQTTDYLLKNETTLLYLYVHMCEATEHDYMNVYLADWKR